MMGPDRAVLVDRGAKANAGIRPRAHTPGVLRHETPRVRGEGCAASPAHASRGLRTRRRDWSEAILRMRSLSSPSRGSQPGERELQRGPPFPVPRPVSVVGRGPVHGARQRPSSGAGGKGVRSVEPGSPRRPLHTRPGRRPRLGRNGSGGNEFGTCGQQRCRGSLLLGR